MPGVKRDSVRCDSDRAARRRMFFWEKEAWISPESSDKAEIWASSNGFPKASTASCGGDARGSMAAVVSLAPSSRSSVSISWYSGDSMRSDSL